MNKLLYNQDIFKVSLIFLNKQKFFFIYQCEEEEKERFLFSLLKSIMFVMN